MAREREKKISRLTKGHAWLSIVFYFIAYHIVTAMLIAVLSIVFYNMLFSRLNAEYSSIEYMAQIYEAADRLGDENTLKILDEDDRPFFVKDIKGDIIYRKGEITCSNEGVDLSMPLMGRRIFVYKDTEKNYFDKGIFKLLGNGIIQGETVEDINTSSAGFEKAMEEIRENAEEEAEESGRNGEEILRDISLTEPGFGLFNMEEMADSIPVWMPVRINSRGYTMVAKVTLGMDVDDIELIVALVEAFILINLLVFVILVFSVIRSIRRQKEITNLLFTDDDTDGNNWMWFLVYAEKLLCRKRNAGRKYALVNLYFVKYRNYCMIHSLEAGKRVLKRVYHTLGGYLGSSALVSHVTSSSFALLMEFQDEEGLKARLSDLISELEKTEIGHKFSFQAGVAVIDVSLRRGRIKRRKSVDLEKEYNYACSARETLEPGEESGIVIYDDRLMEEQKWVDLVTEHQEKALKNEEFVVYYQPKYSPDTNELRGAEALIRWQSPEFGFVSPGRIIPIFEKNGFITNIDHYMLSNVATDQKRWLDQGFDCVPVSVNISRAHFIENDLAEQIRDTVDAVGAPRNLIEIELTESAFFDDKNSLIRTINKLKEYGFKVSMDDFGSGYSSLNSLKDMPLDVLKLDAEFFRGENAGERGRIVVAKTIELAKKLNMLTVAEGIEDMEMVNFLADPEHRCDMIQGYVFARPMSSTDYEVKMKEKTAV